MVPNNHPSTKKNSNQIDALIVGSGPNGLTAAAVLARAGHSVHVIEAADSLGGGTRTAELTIEGFRHDVCSAIHPMGVLSPAFRELELTSKGLEWAYPRYSVAHPLDSGPAVMLEGTIEGTTQTLGVDADAYRRLVSPFLNARELFGDILSPPGIPRHPLAMARLGILGVRSAVGLCRSRFKEARARALFSGCAAHSILPLEKPLTAAVGLVFLASGHFTDWPAARGGSEAIAHALVAVIKEHGGTVEVNRRVRSWTQLPPARVVLFDLTPRQLIETAGTELPGRYKRRLAKFRYGPAVFKVDWALDGPIPWTDPSCADASTVHVGGTMEEIAASEAAVWRGEHPEEPFLILCQQSHLDSSRAPEGQHTGYAYCHVPAGSTFDMTDRIENQIERFAPDFRDRILARVTRNAKQFEEYNPAYIGGAITGGVADLSQAFMRPVARLNPYTTPNPNIFLCSQSTPPGGGVHGMCGYYAAKAALKRLDSPQG